MGCPGLKFVPADQTLPIHLFLATIEHDGLEHKVWPPTHFFWYISVSRFTKKNHLCAWRANQCTFKRGGHCSLSLLPATPLCQSRTLEGLFELTCCPSWALNLASYVASGTSEIQGWLLVPGSCIKQLKQSKP